MVKYLKIPMSGSGEENQILKVLPLIMCESTSTTSTKIMFSGPGAGNQALLSHNAMAANDHSLRIAISDAMAEAMKSPYTSVQHQLNLNGLTAADGSAIAISNIQFS